MNSAVYFLIQSPGMPGSYLKASKFNISNGNGFEVLWCHCCVLWGGKKYLYREKKTSKVIIFINGEKLTGAFLMHNALFVTAVLCMLGTEQEREQLICSENAPISSQSLLLLQVDVWFAWLLSVKSKDNDLCCINS